MRPPPPSPSLRSRRRGELRTRARGKREDMDALELLVYSFWAACSCMFWAVAFGLRCLNGLN
jgi:hypothetical protein